MTKIHFSGNLLTASFGSANAWASANFLELQKPDTIFPSGPLTLREATLVMSIYFVGGFVGNMIFPCILQRYGSKITMLATGLPQIVSYFDKKLSETKIEFNMIYSFCR